MRNCHILNPINSPFRVYKVIDIIPFHDKIAVLQFASADTSKKMIKNGKYVDSYIFVDILPEGFSEQKRLSISFEETKTSLRSEAYYYWEKEQLFISIEYTDFYGTFVNNRVFEVAEDAIIEQQSSYRICEKRLTNDAKVYSFGEKEVSMASPFTMVCRDKESKEILWKYKLSAYLYTEIEAYKGILYFGTAGKGGYFYAISLYNGETVFSYNTGQTVRFIHKEDSIIISDKKQKPILLNALTGKIIKPLDIGQYTIDYEQQMLWHKDYFYTIARNKEKDVLVVCVNI
ncbi:hypothetical protein RCZ04_16630 [Capnocytophaga sp. HP1101]